MTDAPVVHDVPLVEVRLLGPLQVRRRDGTLVQGGEWRTAKTADLLRLLALADGEPVPIDQVLEDLWPDSDEARGRASLRTAASHLRALLGPETVDRLPDGLVLRQAWTDTAAYARLAREAHRLLRAEDLAAAVRAGLEAEALRLGPLSAHEPGAAWATRARARHDALRTSLLAATSEAALSLGWLADATDLARWCLEEDPSNEPVTRTLMQALARQGVEGAALRQYDLCRRTLAEELGVDPARPTRELHLHILSGRTTEPALPTAPGRRREAAALLECLDEARRTDTSVTVRLCGDTPAERRRLVAGLCASSGAALVSARDVRTGLAGRQTSAPADGSERRFLVVHVEGAEDEQVPAVLPDGVVLVLGSDGPLAGDGPLVELHPLLREELYELAVDVLGSRPGGTLLTELAARCGGSHDRAVRTLQGWLVGGRVRSSGRGLVLLDQVGRPDLTGLRTTLSRALQRLPDNDLEVLSLLAVLDGHVSQEQLAPLITASGERGAVDHALARSLDRLCDAGLVAVDQGRVGVRDALMADAVRSWLRPSTLRRLHRTVAERGLVTLAERVGHWLAVGELELACAAALQAADAALGAGQPEDALSHLLQVCSLADVQVDSSGDGADLSAQVASVLRQLGRPEDGGRTTVPGGARPVPVHDLGRVVLGARADVPSVVEQNEEVAPSSTTLLRLVARPDDDDAEARRHLPDEALPELARACGPLPALAEHLVDLLLGEVRSAERGLLRLREDLAADAPVALRACVDLLVQLAAHDLGRRGPAGGWRDLVALAARAGPDWSWAPMLVLVQRGDLLAAQDLDAGGTARPVSELGRQLGTVARAALCSARGDPSGARALLLELVGDAVQSGCTLLLPEAAARLVVAEVGERTAALEHFDLFEWSVGAHYAGPRASTHRLLARAVLRASAGEHGRAASAAGQAAELARASGLGPLAAEAQLARAQYLAASGSAEAVAAMAGAREACRRAGIPVSHAVPAQPAPSGAPHGAERHRGWSAAGRSSGSC